MSGNLYYFVSDVHLGLKVGDYKARERDFSSFIYGLPDNTRALFLLGDIFDFWYEYKNVIPRGFTRTLGAIAAAVDRGIKVYYFSGNHDIWLYDYFQKEVRAEVFFEPRIFELNGKSFYLAHGDRLFFGSRRYKFLQDVFHCRVLQFLFSGIHPRWAFAFGNWWSRHNRLSKKGTPERKLHLRNYVEKNILGYAGKVQRTHVGKPIDFFIFGHFHYIADYKLEEGGRLIMLGEWIRKKDYLVFDGDKLERRYFGKEPNMEK